MQHVVQPFQRRSRPSGPGNMMHQPLCNRNLQENGSQEPARVQPHSWSRLCLFESCVPPPQRVIQFSVSATVPRRSLVLLFRQSGVISLNRRANGYCRCSAGTYRWCGSSRRTIPTKDDVHDLHRAPIPQSQLWPLTGAEFACPSAGPATSRFGTCTRHSSRAMNTKCRTNTEAQQISTIFAHAKE